MTDIRLPEQLWSTWSCSLGGERHEPCLCVSRLSLKVYLIAIDRRPIDRRSPHAADLHGPSVQRQLPFERWQCVMPTEASRLSQRLCGTRRVPDRKHVDSRPCSSEHHPTG